MTATENLRCLLDERGVKWWNDTDPEPQVVTMARVDDRLIEYREYVNDTVGYDVWPMHNLTPAQAVEATLGRVECHVTREPGSDRLWYCDACGSYHEHASDYPWEYCPRCGAKVVSR